LHRYETKTPADETAGELGPLNLVRLHVLHYTQAIVRLVRFALLSGALAFTAHDAMAVDSFEIQVYDGTANQPGSPGLELHVNRVFDGVKTAEAPELPPHHQTHLTLEPSIGVTPFLEIGGYFQTALRADGTFDYAGTKLRTKFVSPEGWLEHLRLGINLEVSLLPTPYDRSRWGGEVRPIVGWENDRWLFALNPIVGVPLGAPDASGGPTFEPAVMAKVKVRQAIAIGFEYYASFGPIASPSPWDGELQYLYEALDLLAVPHFELNAGVGEGLTNASNGFVAKVIVGYSWGADAPNNYTPLMLSAPLRPTQRFTPPP